MKYSGLALWPSFQRGACVLALSALTACASRMDGAPVVDRTGVAPGMNTAAPSDQPPGPPPPGFYRVQPGDTLYRVALQNGQNYRDIASWNNLSNPNQIEVGQLLRVAPPGTTPDANSSMVSSTPLGGDNVQSAPLGGGAPTSNAPNTGYVSPYATPGAANGASAPSPYANGTAPGAPAQDAANVPGAGGYNSTPTMAPTPAPSPASAAPALANGPVSFIWPVKGQILHTFNGSSSKGIDIAGTAGTPVVAAAGGRVLYAGSGLRGYGNLIIIKHNDDFLTAYGHNRALMVKENDVVAKGQKIAEMGDTQADRVMLHFEVRQNTKPVDPMKFLPSQ